MTKPTVPQLITALHALFGVAVPALVRVNAYTGQSEGLLTEEPQEVSAYPTLYTVFDMATFAPTAPVKADTVTLFSRCIVGRPTDPNVEATLQSYIRPLVDSVHLTDAGRRLNISGYTRGLATIKEARGTWATISAIEYRCLELVTEVILK